MFDRIDGRGVTERVVREYDIAGITKELYRFSELEFGHGFMHRSCSTLAEVAFVQIVGTWPHREVSCELCRNWCEKDTNQNGVAVNAIGRNAVQSGRESVEVWTRCYRLRMISRATNGDLAGTDTKVSNAKCLIEKTVDRTLHQEISDCRCVAQIRTIRSVVVFNLSARVIVRLQISLNRL